MKVAVLVMENENHNCINCKQNHMILNEIDKPNNCYFEWHIYIILIQGFINVLMLPIKL